MRPGGGSLSDKRSLCAFLLFADALPLPSAVCVYGSMRLAPLLVTTDTYLSSSCHY